ncbi:FAD/NAD(P)-binding protein [Chryseobacterium indoltheticum]|uniref:FAD/NAD(P)-binding protein n=1 Tax=Chryseobacterium indoltheticum TaxID=254 RepID=UPI003F499C25
MELKGSCKEHVANVSANELPDLIDRFGDYLKKFPKRVSVLIFADAGEKLNPYLVIPRLLLGDYLENQFEQLINIAIEKGILI